MKNKWKTVKLGLMLFALPLMATAAATAHQLMVDSAPINLNVQTPAAVDSAIGLARVHTVALNRNGAIEGRIASIENGNNEGLSSLNVFFVQNGEVVAQTATQSDGSFVAQNVPEGAYSFVATGENGFAAYGVRVVSDATGKLDNLMEAAAVSPNFASVKQIIKEKLPAEVTEQILSTVVADEKRVVGSNRVRLSDGQLQGSVVALLGKDSVEGTYVHIIQDNKQIAEVQTDSSGSFMVSDLEPGVYDFVAAGPSGFAAVSFEAVQEQDSVLTEEAVLTDLVDTDELPVSIEPGAIEPGFIVADPITYQDSMLADIPYDAGYSDSLDVCMTCQQDAGFVSDQVYSGEVYSEPIMGGEVYDAPIEYASEAVGCGCASGATCGVESNFSNFSSCNSCNPCNSCSGGRRGLFGRSGRGLFGRSAGRGGLLGRSGGLFGGAAAGGLGRLALLGGLAVGVTSIADDDGPDSSPNGS